MLFGVQGGVAINGFVYTDFFTNEKGRQRECLLLLAELDPDWSFLLPLPDRPATS